MDTSQDRPLRMEEFEAWLSQNLAGKSLARSQSKRPGRVVFLLRDQHEEIQRCEVYLGEDRIEVRGAWAGSEAVPRLFIRGSFCDWIDYLAEPTTEHARALEFFGPPQVLSTLAELLAVRRGQADIRAGADAPRRKTKRRGLAGGRKLSS